MLVAIALQESRFEHRLQIRGPARGFWQFERAGGVAGVIRHPSTKGLIRGACERLHFSCTPEACHEAIAYNDTLACIFARLLLWTVPGPLPEINDANEAWDYYLDAWRPGKPHRETWDRLHATAVKIVTKGDL
jgi:hypothetical protein